MLENRKWSTIFNFSLSCSFRYTLVCVHFPSVCCFSFGLSLSVRCPNFPLYFSQSCSLCGNAFAMESDRRGRRDRQPRDLMLEHFARFFKKMSEIFLLKHDNNNRQNHFFFVKLIFNGHTLRVFLTNKFHRLNILNISKENKLRFCHQKTY